MFNLCSEYTSALCASVHWGYVWVQYGCGRTNLQYGRSTDTGVRIYSTGEVRIRAYTLAATGVPINTHVRTYGRSTLTFFCHTPYMYTVLFEKLHNVSSVFKWVYAQRVSCQLCFLWHHICKLTWIFSLNTDQSYYLELSNSHKLLIVLYVYECLLPLCASSTCLYQFQHCLLSFLPFSSSPLFLFPPLPSPSPHSLSLTTQWLFWCQL